MVPYTYVNEREQKRKRIDWCSGSEVGGAQEISRNFRFSN